MASPCDGAGVMARSKKRVETSSDPLRSNPFAGLGAALGEAPESEPTPASERPASSSPVVESTTTDPRWRGKIVVRREKKGRGGKVATVVEGIVASTSELQDMVAALRKKLGCGGHVEGQTLVLTGAQGPKVEQWLRQQGAKRVVLGN